jgi:hypothetical protein
MGTELIMFINENKESDNLTGGVNENPINLVQTGFLNCLLLLLSGKTL